MTSSAGTTSTQVTAGSSSRSRQAEVGVHTAEYQVRQDLSLMCDDIHATVQELQRKGLEFRGKPEDEGFGIGVTMLLPGGAELFLYEPRHETAI